MRSTARTLSPTSLPMPRSPGTKWTPPMRRCSLTRTRSAAARFARPLTEWFSQVSDGQHGQLPTTALPNDRFPFTIDRLVPLPETKEGDNTFTVFAHLDQT